MLYAVDAGGRARSASSAPSEDAFDAVATHFELPEGARAFAKELVCGVRRHREELEHALEDLDDEANRLAVPHKWRTP